MTEIIQDGCTISFDENPELKEKVYQRVLKFFKDEDHWIGEGILQSDDPQINAPLVFAEIADELFKFKVDYD